MQFEKELSLDKTNMYRSLGYKTQAPEENIQKEIEMAMASVESAATPRWIWGKYTLNKGNMTLEPIQLELAGKDIVEHLQGCNEVILLAVTLGAKIEQVTRMAQATNMQQAILVDIAASTLIEQYADLTQQILLEAMAQNGEYITSRYSPGYGNFPLSIQPDVLRVLNAQRAIGLTVNESCLLIPRKSITALIGVADKPVKGKLASCGHCVLREKCKGSCMCGA